ncbi:hypothetical protein DH2020_035075 [Rehmannia glutinosa]|uniref:Transcription repressor n=1 Tax=Rehmannia glutinosa TaxID=99300 RepID=A0ABR0V8F7_REHGL
MAKPKSPKLGLSFLNSFQICRPKNPSSMIKTSLPAVTNIYSPINSKSFDISFPGFPDPPPSTPSKSCTHSKPRNKEKMCNSPVSSDSDHETDWSTAPSRTENKKHKNTTINKTSVGARKFKRFGSKEFKENGKVAPCMDQVNQSFIVVKRSVDPYEDFKKSMKEMIIEKQIFEPRELEQLLMRFLSLNSRLHHKVIIEAFTEILQQVFGG